MKRDKYPLVWDENTQNKYKSKKNAPKSMKWTLRRLVNAARA